MLRLIRRFRRPAAAVGRLRAAYFICATPRSGSTLLATTLASTNQVGYAGEYFSEANEPDGGTVDYRAFVSDLVARRSRGEVFGAKLFWPHLERLLAGLRTAAADDALDDRALLASVFGEPLYVWLRRSDVVAQGVSWWKAAQSRNFYVGDPRRIDVTPVFDFDEIQRLVGELRRTDACWSSWFAAHGVEPIPVMYERLAEDPSGVAAVMLEHLGIVVSKTALAPSTVRQSDEVDAAWIARYRDLAGGRASAP